jgi:uncharacterized membrane protein
MTTSRQPILRLPFVMPNGRRIKVHPLLWALQERMPPDTNKSDLARNMGVKPQSLYKWETACHRDRNFPLPILRAGQLARFFNLPAKLFRPDVDWSN